MVEFIGNYFVNKKDAKDSALKTRQIYGTVCSIIGIMLNVCLFAGKYFAGAISGSIAIMADAVNNLSDAGSSFITLIGFRFAGKKPDVDHPFGHGRFEYISGFVVSMAIIMMGFELIKSSFAKIITPVKIETGILSMIILVVSILVKLYMAYMNRSIGNKINSSAMKATAVDSLSDACATFFVLVSMIVIRVSGLNIDGYVGVLVSLFIFYAGYNAAKDTIDPLLGKNPEPEFVEAVKNIVMSHENVVGIHDMVVHDYGPGRQIISLHAEVDGTKNIFDIHDVIDTIEKDLYEKFSIETTIHMDPIDTENEVVTDTRGKLAESLKIIDTALTLHDFRMTPMSDQRTNLIFDVVVPLSRCNGAELDI